MVKVISTFKYTDIMTGDLETYHLVELLESTRVLDEPFKNTHQYWVLDGQDVTNKAAYLEPLDNPDRNIDSDYQQFRDKYHFLKPEDIKSTRRALHLSLIEAAIFLGFTVQTLSDIENSYLMQNYEQEIKLSLLKDPAGLLQMVLKHEKFMKSKLRRQHLNADSVVSRLTALVNSDSSLQTGVE